MRRSLGSIPINQSMAEHTVILNEDDYLQYHLLQSYIPVLRDLSDGISTELRLRNETSGSKSWAFIHKTSVGCHLDLCLITVLPLGSSEELLGHCLPPPQYYEAGQHGGFWTVWLMKSRLTRAC